jgi:hypothetical protein
MLQLRKAAALPSTTDRISIPRLVPKVDRLSSTQWLTPPANAGSPWASEDTLAELWRRGGPEDSEHKPTRDIQVHKGGTKEDHAYINAAFILDILSPMVAQAKTEITQIKSPYRMNEANLLGSAMPNSMNWYFATVKGRNDVFDLWQAALDDGLTIGDFDEVPVLLDGPDYLVHKMDGVVTMTHLSNQAFQLLKPDDWHPDRSRGGDWGGGRGGRGRDSDRERNAPGKRKGPHDYELKPHPHHLGP